MPEATGAEEADAFARLLRELKDRSGLSYGALAKRLHTGTSTLHRYCNGVAVPNEYAPVERLARVCRATPQELVELHRCWILADAARARRADPAPATAAATAPATAADPVPAPPPTTGSVQGPGPAEPADAAGSPERVDDDSVEDAAERARTTSGTESGPVPGFAETPVPAPEVGSAHPTASRGTGGDGGSALVDVPRKPAARRRRTVMAIAFVAVAAVLGVVMAVVRPLSGDGGTAAEQRKAAGPGAAITGTAEARNQPLAPASPDAEAPAGTTKADKVGPGASKSGGTPGAQESTGDGGNGTAPLNVGIRPYVYTSPCSQHFLVDSAPEQVGPPANERDATRWAGAYGAVSSNEQKVALTIQGRDRDTVVLEALHVRIVGKGAPLAWNDYSMGVGCGGDVDTESFDIDLDKGSPTVTVKNGQRDFPYKVSASDPEVFYVVVRTKAHDVRWDLTLDWSSGGRRGTVHIDNKGTPFRTSADVGRPGYDYPLGGGEWIER
ncbi:helix-turn-helix domain-containing protein [Streptomyces sp. SID5474]|nr:helix-turn-helix domain-containing protein [Streptomyces sp. SID5474]